MLTIAGEARRQNGAHPKRSRKGSPVRQCGVPDSSRRAAACADSQNFTCARHVRNWLPYRLTFRFVVILRLHSRESDTGSQLHSRSSPRAAHRPVCMYRHGSPEDRFGFDTRKTAGETGRCGPIGGRSAGPGAHCTVSNRVRSRKCSPQAQSVDSTGCRRRPDTRGTGCQPLPKTLTFRRKCGTAAGTEIAPEKPHRNRRGIKNPNRFRYLCMEGIWLCSAGFPRKASPFDQDPSYDNRMSAPEKSHLCQKVAQQKRDFFQSWRAFRRIRPVTAPEKPHL
ncbi:hypothetical protein DM43_2026 [Burkholderia cepacia]|uniref:Uncharacterized protein n=1 Tax=Burkholderia cepacia TaxID=292 RepID=A0AA88Z2J4_BURCE|nr:hypothetical protein DM43_2026 [Burkholderia cepacia]